MFRCRRSPCPSRTHRLPLERLTQYAAVQLFIERARAATRDFAVTPANGAGWWPRSAPAWMGCRWRSSWRRRGCACLPPQALLARLEQPPAAPDRRAARRAGAAADAAGDDRLELRTC